MCPSVHVRFLVCSRQPCNVPAAVVDSLNIVSLYVQGNLLVASPISGYVLALPLPHRLLSPPPSHPHPRTEATVSFRPVFSFVVVARGP